MTSSLKERDYFYDNAKFFLIVLVVVGHFIEAISNKSSFSMALFIFIYMFHMPLFAFISGHFAKSNLDKSQIQKLIGNILLPYIIFESLYSIVDYYWYEKKQLVFSYFTPYFAMWFLLSLFFWQILIKLFVHLKHPIIISLVLAILIGYALDADYYMSISRTFVFFPFFLAGHYINKEHFKWLFKEKVKLLSILLLAIISISIYLNPYELVPQWLKGSMPYESIHYSALIRSVLIIIAIIMSVCILSLIPNKKLFVISDMGTRTLYPFLLHAFVFKYFESHNYFRYINTPIEKILLVFFSIFLTIFLSTKTIKYLTKYLVEPPLKWIFK